MSGRAEGRISLAVVVGFALGFYVGMLPLVMVMGDDRFNAAFPNPWRLWVLIPATVAIWRYWAEAAR